MYFEAVDHVVFPAEHRQAAVDPFQRLGWRGIAPPPYLGDPAGRRCLFAGAASTNLFHLQIAEPTARPLAALLQRALEERRGLCAVALRVKGLKAVAEELRRKGFRADVLPIPTAGGDEAGSFTHLASEDECGVPLVLCEYSLSVEEQVAEVEAEDGLNHLFPVKRLDHLAAVSRNLNAQTHFWTGFLGVPLFGEVVTPAMVIRQFKIGDAVIELLGPNSPDSPIHQRTPGLISMMSLEVPDLETAILHARGAGFSIPDAAKGVLPGTRTATIPASETGGLALQLLQYN